MAVQQVKEIVDRLNGEPFWMELSHLSFDEKEPLELMEILAKVLVYLDPKHETDLREEKPDAMYQRIAESLHVLGYSCSFDIEFQQGLMSGDKNTVHPIIYWLLCNLETLKKRAYLAKFCVNLEVPEEFLREEHVYEMYQQYKELQSQFKATHSHVEQERQGRMNPSDLQREVAQLDSEREQLEQKIQQLRTKSEKEDGFQQLLQVTSMLRKEQEEEARLQEKLAEQRYQLEQTEQLYIEKSARLREMREAQDQDGEGNAEAMLKMLRSEVQKSRQANARVRRECEEKLARLSQIDSALNEPPVTKVDIDKLEVDIDHMQKEIEDMERTISDHSQDSRLAVYKQQANLVAKKKDLVLKDKKQLEQERDDLSKELSTKEREYEQMKGHKFMKRDEFKNYAASLRDKSAKFKRLKGELSDLRHEVAVLTRTEQILQAKDPTPAGMRETEAMIEKASVEKMQADKAKGKTLDEISDIVQKINAQLKEKKNKLAPQIKALRSRRQNFQQVEVKYLEKKNAYDQAKSSVDGDLSKISGEVRQLETEVLEAEQAYHELNMQLCAAESRLQRAHHETRCLRKEESYSKDFGTLAESYTAEIGRLDELCRDLRKQQKNVKDTHEGNLKQKKAFSCLEKLMKVKLKVAKQEMQNLGDGRPATMMYGTRAHLDASTAGVERLVIE
jgi:intraflagellar transport protein 81